MKTHTKTQRLNILLGLLVATATLAGASVFSTLSNSSAALIRTTNDPKAFFESVKVDPGCSGWLVHQHTGPTMTFWNPDKTVALTQTGTSLTRDLKLTVPAGNYIKYIAYGGSDSHAMNVKLTDTNNQQVGGWYIFSAVKNKSPYRYDASVDSNTAVNVYFKAGHLLQSFNFLAVSYCPVQQSSSSSSIYSNPSSACTSGGICDNFQVCSNGSCVPCGILGPACPNGYACSVFRGQCVPQTSSSSLPNCGTNPPCGIGQTCVNSQCVPNCGSNPPCSLSQTCMNNQCVNNCGIYPPCASGQICSNGMCVPQSSSSSSFCDFLCNGTLVACGTPCSSSSSSQNSSAYPMIIFARPLASSDVAVSNQKNVKLFRFDAFEPLRRVKLEQIEFGAANPEDLKNATNYTLKWDSDGDGQVDTTLQSGVNQQNGKLTFNAIANHVITPGQEKIFEVYADIASSLSTSQLQLRFHTGGVVLTAKNLATNMPINSGTVYKYDGSIDYTYNGDGRDIYLHLGDGTFYTIKNSGDLFISNSPAPIRNRQLLGGKLEDEILRLQLHAEYEDIDVTDLVISANGPNANAFTNDVDSLYLYKVGSTTPFSIATVGGCAGTIDIPQNSMCANLDAKQLVIARGTDQDILVRPFMKTDERGSVAGHMFSLYVDPTPTMWSGTGSVRARGLQSSNTLARNDGDSLPEGEVFMGTSTPGSNKVIQGVSHTVVHSKVLSITNANPDPNGTAIAYGTQPIGQFKFTAAVHGNTKNGSNDWTLSGIIFNVNATNVQLGDGNQNLKATSDFRVYNKANNLVNAVCTADVPSPIGNFTVQCKDIAADGVNTELNAGEDVTFVLEALVVNPKIANTNSTLQVLLTNFTSSTATTMTSATNHIMWKDKDSGYSTNFFWVDYPETTVNSTSYQS